MAGAERGDRFRVVDVVKKGGVKRSFIGRWKGFVIEIAALEALKQDFQECYSGIDCRARSSGVH